MKCPECDNASIFDVYYRPLCTIKLRENPSGELEVADTIIQETHDKVTPERIVCGACDHRNEAEKFGYYTGEMLRKKMQEIIHECLEKDKLDELPERLAEIVLPGGEGVVT